MVLIATWELNGAHPYTITLLINTILGKWTRPPRGARSEESDLEGVENEGFREHTIVKFIAANKTYFADCKVNAAMQGFKFEKGRWKERSGFKVDSDEVIDGEETACLWRLISGCLDGHVYRKPCVDKAIANCKKAIRGSLTGKAAQQADVEYTKLLRKLEKKRYLGRVGLEGYAIPERDRSNAETPYIDYLVKKKIRRLEEENQPGSAQLGSLFSVRQ